MSGFASVLAHYELAESWQLQNEHALIVCPFHGDNNPSLSIDFTANSFYCFGCGEKGTLFDFVRLMESKGGIATLLSAYRMAEGDVATFSGLAPMKSSKQLRSEAWMYFDSLPKPEWELMPHHYMTLGRGFLPETLKYFDVRINPSSHYPVIFPIREQGYFMGTQSRRVDREEPKYIFSKGVHKFTTLAGDVDTGVVLVTEGWLDLMKAWEYGARNVCTALNWSMSIEQVNKLLEYATGLIIALDNDETGDNGYEDLKSKVDIPTARFVLPDGYKDIAELSRKQFVEAYERAKEAI